MNKTVNMNLGGIPFQIDDIAYEKLKSYINAVRTKFQNVVGYQDIIDDIEARLGEMFQESLDKENRAIVSIHDVDAAITVMGKPEEFGYEDEDGSAEFAGTTSSSSSSRTVKKKLFRDPDDKWLGGVLSGLSKYAGIDNPIWFRLFFIALLTDIFWIGIPVSSSTLVLVYIILWIAVPKAMTSNDKMRMHGEEVTLANIERKANEFSKKVTSNTPKSTISDGFSAVFGGIVKIIALVFMGIGIAIAACVMIALFIALVSVIGVGLAEAPFLNDHIFGSSGATWLALGGAALAIAAPIVYFFLLFIKLLFKTKLNMPVLALGSLGALIVGIIMSSVSVGNVISDMKRGATVEETTAISLAGDNLTLSATDEFTDYSFDDGHVSFTIDEAEFSNDTDVRIVKSKDSIARVTTKLRAYGKTNQIARDRVENMNFATEVLDSNTLRLQKSYVLGEKELWRRQHADVRLEVPVGTTFSVDESVKYIIENVDKASGYNSMTIYNGKWLMTEDGLKKLDDTGEILSPESFDDDDEKDGWEDWDDNWGSENRDTDESVEVELFGKKILDVKVTERDEDGEADRVQIRLKNGKLLDIDVNDGEGSFAIEEENSGEEEN